jgi:CMP/dCMP kinase
VSGMTADPTVVTIDGPSGAGKGTISRQLATRLQWRLLDSGALYRLVALAGTRAALAAADQQGHAELARRMNVQFGAQVDGSERIELDGEEVTASIRTEEAGMGASRVASWPAVREALLERQRGFATAPGLVADGRDMGTVVFPAARLKIFLTASPAERAQRRYKQLKDKGSAVNLAALSREIAERDRQDATRVASPLVAASDAVRVDSTGKSIAEVLGTIWRLGATRGLWSSNQSS